MSSGCIAGFIFFFVGSGSAGSFLALDFFEQDRGTLSFYLEGHLITIEAGTQSEEELGVKLAAEIRRVTGLWAQVNSIWFGHFLENTSSILIAR